MKSHFFCIYLQKKHLIEMKKITEEDKYNAEFLANPYFIGTHGAEVVSAHQVGFNNGVEWALKQMDSKKEDIQFYKDAEKKAWYYIKNEVYFDMDYYRWFKAKMEAEKEGKEFTEPEPKFDNEKVKFNGIDMFNAFMRGYRLYRELRDGEFVLGLDNTEEKTLNETAKKR